MMKSRGVQHDPLSDIANIRNTLKGYGVGFSIIKELVQNAEDAKASFIHIGWHPGFPTLEATHPLLQGPAICMVNDGPFEKEHEDAICRMGLGSKGADEQSIGRFGLGLKSVFHLCEAFFFIASDLETGANVRLLELFNPWHGKHHSEWDIDYPDAQSILTRALSGFLPSRPWFALWLPLRRREMCNGVAPIVPGFPGDINRPPNDIKHFFSEELDDVLPALRNLCKINYSVWESEHWNEHYSIETTSDSIRRKYPDKISEPWEMFGTIKTSCGANDPVMLTRYTGRESWVEDVFFKNVKGTDAWPKVVALREDGSVDPGKKEKALPHFSNYFICRHKKNTKAKLRIKWAVFLPVGNDLYDEVMIPNFEYDITFILHGYFFLNSERTNIDGLENNFTKSNGIYTDWNKKLASLGNLAGILPALEQFVNKIGFSDSQIQLITNALVESRIFRNYKEIICSNHQWIYRVYNNSAKWCCIPAEEDVYPLSTPSPENYHFPYDVFPNLKFLTEQYHICYFDDLTNENSIVSSHDFKKWSETMLEKLHGNLDKAFLNNQPARRYLWKIIKLHSPLSKKQWKCFEEIQLFEVRSSKTGIETTSSLNELIKHSDSGGLFSGSSDAVLEQSLQSVCVDLELKILITGGLDLQLLPSQLQETPELNMRSCARTVLSSKRLGAINSRISLLEYLIHTVQLYSFDEIYKNMARYLMHNDYSKINDQERLYLPSNENSVSKTWNKVAEMALSVKGELWRMIDQGFDQYLTQQFLTKCRIEKISVNIICDLLKNIEISKLNTGALDLDDRRNLLLNLSDENLIKNLPIHEKIGGDFVSISELSYLENDFQIHPNVKEYWEELLSRACVIKRLEDAMSQARQKEILPELDWHAAIELALTSPTPVKYASVIMAGLRNLGTPRQEVGILLRQIKWLPLNISQAISPQNVIHIEQAQEEIHRILKEEDDGLCGVLALDDWIHSHPGLKALKQQFLNKKESLEYLGLWLSERENVSVGLSRIENPEEFHEFVDIFISCPSEVMPLHPLLSSFKSDTELLQMSFQFFLSHVQVKVGPNRIKMILNFLCSKHKESTIEIKRKILKWFNRYLQQAISNGYIDKIIGKIELLNQLGHWQATSKLTLPSEGIAKRHQLNNEQAQILKKYYGQENHEESLGDETPTLEIDTEDIISLKISSEHLIKYFEKLERTGVPREMIGAVAGLLGNYEPIKELANKMLGDQSLDTIRAEMIPKRVPPTILDLKRFVVKVIDGDTSYATSLTGEPFQVTISENPTSLLFGNDLDLWWSINHPETSATNCHQIKLLSTENFQDISHEEIAKFLRKTAELIIFNVYCNRVAELYPDIQHLWEKLNETGQRNIISAQLYLLNAGDFYIKQLGSNHQNVIRLNLQKWERARQYKVDSELYPNQREKLLQKAEKVERESREELRQLLISDDEVHEIFVDAFRKKMTRYQYDISSIPFELFQNADDAYQELVNMGCDLESDNNQKPFVMCLDKNNLQFVHWGRCINEHHRQGAFDRGKDLGFDRDLQKMLTLSYSDKGIDNLFDDLSSNQDVTGKFGLGFKSVFFATSSPRILSGRLSFYVRGGFYPRQLDRENEFLLQNQLNDLRPGQQYKGTMFDLPLNTENGDKTDQILSRFLALVSFQLVFSKQIKKCEIYSTTQEPRTFSWQEKRVNGTHGFFVGELLSKKMTGYKSVLVMRFQKGDNKLKECSLLFSLDVKGFTKFPDEIPSIWITAPTQEKNAVGFIVNGPFEPDVGRSLLARNSETNKNLTNDLSRSVGDAWIELYENSQTNWPEIASSLRLAHDCSHEGFWESLWTLMCNTKLLSLKNEPIGSSANLLYILTWGNSYGGYRKLINNCSVIPSKLWGEYNTLLSVPDIEYRVDGVLDQKHIFETVSTWPSFRKKVGTGRVVSGTQIGSVLKKTAATDIGEINGIRFTDAISWELNNRFDVSPQNAKRIGRIIDKEFQYHMASSGHQEELAELEDRFKKFKFKSNVDDYTLIKDLIVALRIPDYISEDEVLRASFAPDNLVLSSEYDVDAIKFLVVCRGNMVAPSEELAKWVLGAEHENRRKGALLYISQGELGDKVAAHLRHRGTEGTWLTALRFDSEYFEGWSEEDIKELLFRKLTSISILEEMLQEDNNFYEQGTTVIRLMDVAGTLQNIYTWWQSYQDEYITKYEIRTYPDRTFFGGLANDDRSAWLTILMIGSFHTFGRAKPEQHRGFLALCEEKGWWNVFTRENPREHPDKWMGILDDYINNQVEDSKFEYWMRLFPTIYKFARDIEEYIEVFYEIEKQGEDVNVVQVMASKTFSDFQGGGITAAPIARTLGMGVTFILREMMRKSLFNKNQPNISPYCYVPLGRVRNLFSKMGCDDLENEESPLVKSRVIHDFLCKYVGPDNALFDNAFDIPFQYVAEELELQEQLFV